GRPSAHCMESSIQGPVGSHRPPTPPPPKPPPPPKEPPPPNPPPLPPREGGVNARTGTKALFTPEARGTPACGRSMLRASMALSTFFPTPSAVPYTSHSPHMDISCGLYCLMSARSERNRAKASHSSFSL